eukprot:m.155661 g.155661  ORF g.155661 m.155661 type:complete len:314 (+) comp30948_c0_seq1:168-1109(+)
MDLLNQFKDFENNFNGQEWIDWTAEHTEVPVFAIAIYLIIVFWIPPLLRDSEPFKLKICFIFWNVLLSTFSICGMLRTVPLMISTFQEHGFHYTACMDPKAWYLMGPSGLWTTLFIFSKIPELGDTFFLVIQKKKVIFLHWFHHVTVLLYCWHAFVLRSSTGFWFVTMNFTVHSIMYTYYLLSILGMRQAVRRVAPIITSMQLIQMFVGCFVTVYSARQYSNHGADACHVNPSNFKMGLGMYFSYLVLFAKFFYNLYLAPGARYAIFKQKETKDETPKQKENAQKELRLDDKVCGVEVDNVEYPTRQKKNKDQ